MSYEDLPPQSKDAEEAFLSACIYDPNVAVDAGLEVGLTPDDFYVNDHGSVWRAILNLRNSKQRIDIITVVQALENLNEVKDARMLVVSINSNMTGSSLASEAYARVIRDKSLRRGLILAASSIARIGYDEASGDDIEASFDKADNVLRRLRTRVPSQGREPDPADIIARLEGAKASGIKTRLPALNLISSGMIRGYLWVIGGFSSTGKSAVVVNLMEDVVRAGGATMIASTEMSQEQYLLRAISLTSGVPQRTIRHGGMTLEQQVPYNASKEFWKTAKVRVFDNLYNVARIRSRARRVKESIGLDVLFVDFLQNINETGDEVKDARIAAISLQALAKELDICVVALSQISNSMAQIQNDQGGMTNYYAFKGSGAIKDAADLAVMLERDRISKPDVLWWNVVKNRHDSMTKFACRMDLETGRLSPMTDEEERDADPNAGRRSRK